MYKQTSIRFLLRVPVITSLTSNITSTSGTFPLYLMKQLAALGLSLRGECPV